MNVLFLARSTLYTVSGGDTIQILATAKYLRKLGVTVDIKLSNETIDYKRYNLIHVFNVTRPADALRHVTKSNKPYVISTIYIDFSDYLKTHAKGLAAVISRNISIDALDYTRTIGRWLKSGESIKSKRYIFMGQRRAVQELTNGAAHLLPNSESEYQRFAKHYNITKPHTVIYNGVDTDVFKLNGETIVRDDKLVVCVARIEDKKNQLNLIRALNNTSYKLKLIGKPAPNHGKYYNACLRQAATNVTFEGFVPQEKLLTYYQEAKVHVLPSWNETCGLSSLEAVYAGCNIVITDKGDTKEYYGNNAWYCDPESPDSIFQAVEKASQCTATKALHNKVIELYNWKQAANDTLAVYEQVLKRSNKIDSR